MTASWNVGMDRLNKQLKQLSQVPAKLADYVKETIDADIKETFSSEQNPYGTPWRVRKRFPHSKDDGHPVLNKTGKLKRSFSSAVEADGSLSFDYSAPYAVFHQEGTRHMSQRLLLPTTVRGVPKRWKEALLVAFRKSIQEIFG